MVGALARADDNAGGTAANARATAAAAEARSASMCCRTRSSICFASSGFVVMTSTSHTAINPATPPLNGYRAPGYVQGRNALLVQTGAAVFEPRGGLLALGLIAGAHYVDCTPAFVVTAQRVLDLYFDGRVQLAAPLIDRPQAQVVAELRREGFPIALTYSCEAGTTPACGVCLSCRDRSAA
ncbi:MAG: hypothetical protein E6J91_10490 [Deltaproteobacteria bacterium]|nr:MAG: hypothetical protein E6J91_10490 [Deltaproteobacteria bacterium]